jgi:hypothetical protein
MITLASQKRWEIKHLYVKLHFFEDFQVTSKRIYTTRRRTCLALLEGNLWLKVDIKGLVHKDWQFLECFGLIPNESKHNLHFLVQGGQYVVLIVFVDDLLLTGNNTIAWNPGTKLHYTIWNDKHGIHELLHRFGMYLFYLRDIVHIMKLFMENILQVWHAWLSMYGNSYEWRHPTMSTYEFRGCGCYVLSTMHGKSHLPHTHTHTSRHYMSMNVVNRFISNLQKVHINATKHVYWYVKSAFEFETFFVHENNALLIRWVDANWTHDLDTGRSTTWMFFKFGYIPLSWTNKLQPIITLSNTKAKYKSFFRSC